MVQDAYKRRELDNLIHDALHEPTTAITYAVSRQLRELYPDKRQVEGDLHAFDLESYAATGLCEAEVQDAPLPQFDAYWGGPNRSVGHHTRNAWMDVRWQGESFQVLLISWDEQMHGGNRRYFLLADSVEAAERFIDAVCRWNTELRDEVLVFERGHWQKDPALFQSIKGATLDNLVLQGSLKRDIYDDLSGFFEARETYARYAVPWKRGILFVGPPGNGKTHAVKALVNALGRDCLYVKSFRSQMPDEYSIHTVFAHARVAAPCILVLEDLDSLITAQNRSFFLNELDGFAGNEGMLTLATTNHPERLDPAIVDRPSRFDRKYPFDLPAVEERRTYIAMWNESLQPELRLSAEGIDAVSTATAEFSFAYLKELFVSATMRWIHTGRHGAMDGVMAEQVEILRGQMASAISFEAGQSPPEPTAHDAATHHVQVHHMEWDDPLVDEGWHEFEE